MPGTEYEKLVALQKEGLAQCGRPGAGSGAAGPTTQLDNMTDRLRDQIGGVNELAGRLDRVINGLAGEVPATREGNEPPVAPLPHVTKLGRLRVALDDQDAALSALSNVVVRFETDL